MVKLWNLFGNNFKFYVGHWINPIDWLYNFIDANRFNKIVATAPDNVTAFDIDWVNLHFQSSDL